LAPRVTRRHRLLEAFLMETFDMRPDRVQVEVDRLEHHVSAVLEN
jgi:Mn-dependent DtxR family transcriptional regulator